MIKTARKFAIATIGVMVGLGAMTASATTAATSEPNANAIQLNDTFRQEQVFLCDVNGDIFFVFSVEECDAMEGTIVG